MKNTITRIGIVDDHNLFRKGIRELIDGFPGYTVVLDADNGKDLISKLNPDSAIDVILVDVNMKEMDGFETATWLTQHFPDIKILALSMLDNEQSVIKMLRSGAKGYVLKDVSPEELKIALNNVVNNGFHQSELTSKVLMNNVRTEPAKLNDREQELLKLVCTELTYKEIADKMCLSPRTIDGYRENLFEKLEVKNRVGLVLYAIRNGHVKLE